MSGKSQGYGRFEDHKSVRMVYGLIKQREQFLAAGGKLSELKPIEAHTEQKIENNAKNFKRIQRK
jgi:hypothetical protein